MTREEAINILNQEVCSFKKLEVIEMAIKALSVDYDGMAKELSKFSGIGGLNKKAIVKIIKKIYRKLGGMNNETGRNQGRG